MRSEKQSLLLLLQLNPASKPKQVQWFQSSIIKRLM